MRKRTAKILSIAIGIVVVVALDEVMVGLPFVALVLGIGVGLAVYKATQPMKHTSPPA